MTQWVTCRTSSAATIWRRPKTLTCTRRMSKVGSFWIDQLDERFWSIHTDMPARAAWARLRTEVEARRELDWIWLPSNHLRNLWPNSVAHRVHTVFGGSRLVGNLRGLRGTRRTVAGLSKGRRSRSDLVGRSKTCRPSWPSCFHLVFRIDFGVFQRSLATRLKSRPWICTLGSGCGWILGWTGFASILSRVAVGIPLRDWSRICSTPSTAHSSLWTRNYRRH